MHVKASEVLMSCIKLNCTSLYPVLMVGSQYRQRHSRLCSIDSGHYSVMIRLKRKLQNETSSTDIMQFAFDNICFWQGSEQMMALCVPWFHFSFVKIELALRDPELAQIVIVIAK